MTSEEEAYKNSPAPYPQSGKAGELALSHLPDLKSIDFLKSWNTSNSRSTSLIAYTSAAT